MLATKKFQISFHRYLNSLKHNHFQKMFERLQQKWKVGPVQIVLIIICFALGGSATGYIGGQIMDLFSVEENWLWVVIYIIVVTLTWPLAVLTVSVFFGQFEFFLGYVKTLGKKIGLAPGYRLPVVTSKVQEAQLALQDLKFSSTTTNSPLATYRSPINIAIFASGAGSNAQKIIDHFHNSDFIRIALIVCNKKKAGVLEIAKKENISSLIIEKEKFFSAHSYLNELKEKEIDFIVLAGFLWKIPEALIQVFPKRIINIHPALLPKYGGKGMYGNYVHEAVIADGENESGITIHYVDEHYDNGDVILQVKCPVLKTDTAESLAQRIHALEHANYPIVIEELIKKLQH
jgi:formyltetrahydrofolate-dependent phosphoribosylglycinamide formyltransferase